MCVQVRVASFIDVDVWRRSGRYPGIRPVATSALNGSGPFSAAPCEPRAWPRCPKASKLRSFVPWHEPCESDFRGPLMVSDRVQVRRCSMGTRSMCAMAAPGAMLGGATPAFAATCDDMRFSFGIRCDRKLKSPKADHRGPDARKWRREHVGSWKLAPDTTESQRRPTSAIPDARVKPRANQGGRLSHIGDLAQGGRRRCSRGLAEPRGRWSRLPLSRSSGIEFAKHRRVRVKLEWPFDAGRPSWSDTRTAGERFIDACSGG
jgi:hypothetical protein